MKMNKSAFYWLQWERQQLRDADRLPIVLPRCEATSAMHSRRSLQGSHFRQLLHRLLNTSRRSWLHQCQTTVPTQLRMLFRWISIWMLSKKRSLFQGLSLRIIRVLSNLGQTLQVIYISRRAKRKIFTETAQHCLHISAISKDVNLQKFPRYQANSYRPNQAGRDYSNS